MKFREALMVLLPALALAACATSVGPVEVTRFHTPQTLPELGGGSVAIVAGPDMDGNSLEFRTFAAAVTEGLVSAGYVPVISGASDYKASVKFERFVHVAEDRRSPVSVGVGGSTGSYGSGLGLGIGIDLSGKPKDRIITELFVAIRRTSDDQTVWEGRATSEAKSGTPAAETALSANKLAKGLFAGFPGESGRTIAVP